MPLEQDDLDRLKAAEGDSTKTVVRAPSEAQKLGATTVACLILNRTIGAGVFVSPTIVLQGTQSAGISLLFWALGGIVAISGLYVWLELGLSIPKFEGRNVPRNGGEKNYLEYIYSLPPFLTTCVYGVTFITLGNLAGNSIALGIYVLQAAGYHSDHLPAAAARGLAIAALTLSCVIHAVWRRGGLAAIAGVSFGHGKVDAANLDPHTSFSNPRSDVVSYMDSIPFIIYSLHGFKQPFYVLGEVSRPKKIFAKATISAMVLVIFLYLMVNVAFLSVVSKGQPGLGQLDIATVFAKNIFGNDIAPRVMAGMIAFSIFGHIVVMTFTASRVKQEIAKEGVVPFSSFFSSNTTTPFAKFQAWRESRKGSYSEEEMREQSPAAALFLHWSFSVILIGATSGQTPVLAYRVLVSLYSYVLIILQGFFVASGLLYLRWKDGNKWTKSAGFKPLGGPTAAIIYSFTCAFLLITAFVPPSSNSSFSYHATHVYWFIVPTVGLGSGLIGVAYYLVFRFAIPRLKLGKQLVVNRCPVIVNDEDGEGTIKIEIIEHSWKVPETNPILG